MGSTCQRRLPKVYAELSLYHYTRQRADSRAARTAKQTNYGNYVTVEAHAILTRSYNVVGNLSL